MQTKAMKNGWKTRLNLTELGFVETAALLMLFLFPVFAVSLRHWLSVLFQLLVLLAVLSLTANLRRISLTSTEKALLTLLSLFFLTYLISSLINGWNEGATRLLEREIRFLLFVPLYFLMKRLPSPIIPLGFGAATALSLTAILAPIQAFFLGYDRDVGTYGPLFTGPISVLLLVLALAWVHIAAKEQYKAKFSMVLFLITFSIAALTSRSALVGLGLVFALYYTMLIKAHRQFFIGALFFTTLIAARELSGDSIAPQFMQGISEAYSYIVQGAGVISSEPSSIGIRLEMWRSLKYFVQDYPFWGVGGYNYSQVLAGYASQGLVAQTVVEHSHPHNLFGQIFVTKGLVGLTIFLSFCGLSFVNFLRREHLKKSKDVSLLGVVFLLALLVMNLTESAPVLKGNYIAFWLVAYAAFLSSVSQERTR